MANILGFATVGSHRTRTSTVSNQTRNNLAQRKLRKPPKRIKNSAVFGRLLLLSLPGLIPTQDAWAKGMNNEQPEVLVHQHSSYSTPARLRSLRYGSGQLDDVFQANSLVRTCPEDSWIPCDGKRQTFFFCHMTGKYDDTYESRCLSQSSANKYYQKYSKDYCGVCREVMDLIRINSTCDNSIASFTLIDVGVKPWAYYTLRNRISLKNIVGPFNLRANSVNMQCTNSVSLNLVTGQGILVGNNTCDGYQPYTVFGDPAYSDLSDEVALYNVSAKQLGSGNYVITATPYRDSVCSTGRSGKSLSVAFSLVTPYCENRLAKVSLVDLGVEPAVVYDLRPGISLTNVVGPFKPRAHRVDPTCTRGVRLELLNKQDVAVTPGRCVNNVEPVELSSAVLADGNYRIKAVPWSGSSCSSGTTGSELSVPFSICTNRIANFTLVDVGKKPWEFHDLYPDVALTSVVGPFNLRANAVNNACTDSIRLELLNGTGSRLFKLCDKTRPYTVFGDPARSDLTNEEEALYNATAQPLSAGRYTIKAVPWTKEGCVFGKPGDELNLTFSIN